MVFSSILFLFYFLPLFLLIYIIAPNKLKNLVLLLTSLTFYAWGEVRFVVVMLVLSVVDFLCGRMIEKHLDDRKKMKLYMFIDVCTNLAVLFFFKYSDFFISNFNMITGLNVPLLGIPLPIGVSFNTFQSISYIIDVYRRKTTCEKSYYNYLTYTTLFPQIIAGPIVRYVTVENEIASRKLRADDFTVGMKKFLLGLGKKVLIANNVGVLWDQISNGHIANMSTTLYWVGIFAFALQIYYDFSGYSDMAIGLARIIGMRFDINFEYPYISKSITEFWRRWHMTLGSWFRDYVYIPLGGNKKGWVIQIRNILIVWGLTGFWHGASWNYIIWGLYFAILLILEKFIILNKLKKVPAFFQHLYLIFLILVSWVIFSLEDTKKMFEYLKGMFGLLPVDAINTTAIYYLIGYFVIFTIACIASTPLIKNIYDKINARFKYTGVIDIIIYVLILLTSTAYLVNSTYNPFLYFRF